MFYVKQSKNLSTEYGPMFEVVSPRGKVLKRFWHEEHAIDYAQGCAEDAAWNAANSDA